MAEVVIQGMQELLGKMDGLPLSLQKIIVARTLRAAAEPIRARAQELAPIDETQAEHPLREEMMTVVSEQTATGATARIGSSRRGFYGTFQEFGTSRHAANPFLVPAFEEKIGEATQIAGEQLAGHIERAFR